MTLLLAIDTYEVLGSAADREAATYSLFVMPHVGMLNDGFGIVTSEL